MTVILFSACSRHSFASDIWLLRRSRGKRAAFDLDLVALASHLCRQRLLRTSHLLLFLKAGSVLTWSQTPTLHRAAAHGAKVKRTSYQKKLNINDLNNFRLDSEVRALPFFLRRSQTHALTLRCYLFSSINGLGVGLRKRRVGVGTHGTDESHWLGHFWWCVKLKLSYDSDNHNKSLDAKHVIFHARTVSFHSFVFCQFPFTQLSVFANLNKGAFFMQNF